MVDAAPTADALPVIMLNRAVFGDVHGPRGANRRTGGIFTVVAGRGKMNRGAAFRQGFHPPEEFPGPQLVLLLTGDLARLAPDASRRVV